MFKKGSQLICKKTGLPKWEKVGDNEWDWWVCLDSYYLVPTVNELGEKIDVRHPESEKPLYNKEGNLNRWSFRWTDEQVKVYYLDIYNFKIVY